MRLVRMLKELSEHNKITVLVSSHDLNHITDVCHRILLMEKGRIIKDLDTTADTLQELEAYFSV
jgi:ABC-2 type transport system ATP-binding protein